MSSDNYESLLARCIDSLRSCKELTTKYLNNDETALSTIQDLTKEYCQANFEVEKADRALAKLRDHLKNKSDQEPNIDELYNQFLNEDETELVYTDTGIWSDVFSGEDIEEVVQKKKKLSDAAYDKVDDSLLCSNVFEPPIDPISKTIIKEPYKNKFCGHVFDYESILNYIQERKNKAKCPYMGCTNNVFRAADLRPDMKLREQVSQYLETHQDTESSGEE